MRWSEGLQRALLASCLFVAIPAVPASAGGASQSSVAGAASPEAVAVDTSQGAACARVERDAESLLANVRAQGEALGRRERIVHEQEQTDAAARAETARRLGELEALRAGVDERVARLTAATEERVVRLADLYGRMPPDRAAAVLDSLAPELAAQIVERMRRPRAAALLAALPAARAADLSRRIVRPVGSEEIAPPLASAQPKRARSGAASVP